MVHGPRGFLCLNERTASSHTVYAFSSLYRMLEGYETPERRGKRNEKRTMYQNHNRGARTPERFSRDARPRNFSLEPINPWEGERPGRCVEKMAKGSRGSGILLRYGIWKWNLLETRTLTVAIRDARERTKCARSSCSPFARLRTLARVPLSKFKITLANFLNANRSVRRACVRWNGKGSR